jgi:hypothetical protein
VGGDDEIARRELHFRDGCRLHGHAPCEAWPLARHDGRDLGGAGRQARIDRECARRAATSWPVPAQGGFEDNGFAVSSSTRWSTLDIDGDHRADLVSAAGLSNGSAEVWGVGATRHWKIFRNVP